MESRVGDTVDIGGEVRCPDCGGAATTRRHRHVFRYGRGGSAADIAVDLPVRHCGACGFEFVDEEGERLKHEAVCRHLRVLAPPEIRGIRRRQGMTRAAFAAVTGLGEASLARWETGAGIQSHANDRYLRLLAQPGGISRLSSVLRAMVEAEGAHVGKAGPSRSRFLSLHVNEEVRRDQSSFELVVTRKAA